ncbi:MAG: hypothetical protein JWO38_7408 [Gemmataceae bacterium]|nr:hypothetical protein [Gemmataceae bacterium]
MPSSPLRARTGSRLAAWAVLAAGALAIPVGCETVRPAGPAEPHDTAGRPDVVHRASDPGTPPTPPGRHAIRRGNYVFYHDFELDKSDPLFAELEALPDQVLGELGLPPTTGIVQVFLFDTRDRYNQYLKSSPLFRGLPPRRAYFITEKRAGGDELKVFTWMGDHLRTDLRHELTHALLHSVLKDVPIWLDEGLAGYFELPPEQDGVNPQHLELIRRGPFQPNLARLERLKDVAEMQQPEYREAWAWVHLMLRSSPAAKRVLLDYLQVMRTTDKPGPLAPRLREALPELDEALFDYLTRLELPRVRPAGARY